MKKTFCSLALGFLSLAALAQPRLPEHYYWKQLSNGLQVVVIENDKVPLATIEIAVKNGAYTEGPEYSGLSHLFEHMFFKANQEYPDQENEQGAFQDLPDSRGMALFLVLFHSKAHGIAYGKQEKGKYQVSRCAAMPGGMLQRGIYI